MDLRPNSFGCDLSVSLITYAAGASFSTGRGATYRDGMGVEPTAASFALPATDFEDQDAHRDACHPACIIIRPRNNCGLTHLVSSGLGGGAGHGSREVQPMDAGSRGTTRRYSGAEETVSVAYVGPAPTTTLNFATIVRTGNRMTADSSPLPGRPHSASIATAGMHWRRTESSAQRVRTAMPDEASPLPLDIEEELHLQFPPKSIRVVQGKVARRERATFRSELLDQTLAE